MGKRPSFVKRSAVGVYRHIYGRDLLTHKAKPDSNRRSVLDGPIRAEAEHGQYEPQEDCARYGNCRTLWL